MKKGEAALGGIFSGWEFGNYRQSGKSR